MAVRSITAWGSRRGMLRTRKRQPDEQWWRAVNPLCDTACQLAARLRSCTSTPTGPALLRGDTPWSRADVSRLDEIARESAVLNAALRSIRPPHSGPGRTADRDLRSAFKQLRGASRNARDAAWITVELRAFQRVQFMPLGGVARKGRLANRHLGDAETRLACVAQFRSTMGV